MGDEEETEGVADADDASELTTNPGPLRGWYLAQPPVVVLVATTVVALLGGILLWAATELSFPAVGLAGVVVATGAAWVTTDYTAERWRHPGTPAWKAFVLGAAAVGAIAVVVANALRSPLLAFLGLMALTFGIGPFVSEVRSARADAAERWMHLGLAVGLLSSIVIVGQIPTLVRFAAFAGLLIGFGLFTGGLSTMCARGALPGSWVLKIIPGDARTRGLFVGAAGLAILLSGLAFRRIHVVSVGAWLTIVAMIMLSVKPGRFGMSTLMKRSILAAGLGLVCIAGYQLYATGTFGRSAWFTTFIVLTVALAGAWIVWRGATLFIGVIFGFAFVWGLFSYTTPDADHVSTARADDAPAAAGVVAFGDSFISGEGAPQFYAGTDQKGERRNECRRAPTAYPVLISLTADGRPADAQGAEPAAGLTEPGLDFFACSGAKLGQVLALRTDDLIIDEANRTAVDDAMEIAEETGDDDAIDSMESVGEPEADVMTAMADCDIPSGRSVGQYPCGPDGVHGSQLQLDHLAADRSATQLVLLSVGGNDVRFGDIVAGCLLPGSCAERREIWLDNVAAIGPELTEAYAAIRSAFDDDVPIVVMPYPLVLTEDSCADSPLDASEHEFIFEFTTVLNRQIATSAAQAGVHYFAPGAFALEGNRLCESDARAINLIRLQPSDGPVFTRLNPGAWTHNSMHPNRLGHQMIADALRDWLARNAIVGSGNPDPSDASTAPLLDVRIARPFAVAPAVDEALSDSGVGECGFDQIDSFATRIAVFDEEPGDGTPVEAFRVPVAGADPSAPLCVTDSMGDWTVPDPNVDRSGDASKMRLPSADPAVEIIDGRVFVSGGRPDERCRERHDDDLCEFQWVLFSSPTEEPDAPMAERTWSLRAVQYCTTDPDCENTFGEWTDSQISQAARRVAATLGMIFLGGWLFALGIELVAPHGLSSKIRRRLEPRLAGDVAPGPGTPADPSK